MTVSKSALVITSALRERYGAIFTCYGEHYVSALHEFAAHTINAIPATTFAMVYSCATSLVSSELINIKHIEVKKRFS